MSKSLILASQSPRRLELLKQINIVPNKIIPADVDESYLKNELPSVCAKRLSLLKAEKIAETNPDAFILSADTIVACGRRMLGKPENEAEARKFLDLLSGRRHRVYGGICLITPDGKKRIKLSQSIVLFKCLSKEEKENFVQSDEWVGKAGGYAIQGLAASFIDFISGSYSNIVGLDLCETSKLLKSADFK
ncbi:MAG: Maf family protein [Alphaproteobacteria bacterium]|nr:Maf family protein [Alphaproteobacteria bacterium]